MRNRTFSAILALCAALLTGCAASDSDSVVSAAPADSVEAFELIDTTPYAIFDGKVYFWDNGEWELYYTDNTAAALFSGEHFCALDSDGSLIADVPDYLLDDTENSLPLSSAADLYSAERMLEINESKPFVDLSESIVNLNVIALCTDGSLITLVLYD